MKFLFAVLVLALAVSSVHMQEAASIMTDLFTGVGNELRKALDQERNNTETVSRMVETVAVALEKLTKLEELGVGLNVVNQRQTQEIQYLTKKADASDKDIKSSKAMIRNLSIQLEAHRKQAAEVERRMSALEQVGRQIQADNDIMRPLLAEITRMNLNIAGEVKPAEPLP